jgi:hypothetical protein
MYKLVWICLLAGVSLLQPSMAQSAEMIKPGLWEISTVIEMPGIPFQQPPQTVRHCISQQEAKDPVNTLPMSKDCKILDLRSSENKINWKVECSGEMSGKGEGEIARKSDLSYEGTTKIQTQGIIFNMKHKGTRIGECP